MDTDLEAHGVGLGNKGVQLVLRPERQATIFRIVRIRFEQGRAATAKRAIGVQFDGSDIQPIIALATQWFTDCIEDIACAAEHCVDAHVEFVHISHRQINLDVGEVDTGVVDARDSLRDETVDRRLYGSTIIVLVRFRNVAGDQGHGFVDQYTRCVTALVADDLAADRVRRVVVDACNAQRRRIRPAGMPVDPP